MRGTDLNTIRKEFEKLRVASYAHYTVLHENEEKDVPDEGPWMRVTILPGISFQSTFGAEKSTRYPFILEIAVFLEVGKGTKILQDIADAAIAYFNMQRKEGIPFQSVFVTPLGRENKWVHWNVNCPGYADVVVLT